MKALILAAGLGTRLLPHTRYRPKPLFTLAGRTMLERCIHRLASAGCTRILVNTHHLHDQIISWIRRADLPVPVTGCHEPRILDTGGAVLNLRRELEDAPFWVFNADVVTDLDLVRVRDDHLAHDAPATLVLHDRPGLNGVAVDSQDFITGFHAPHDAPAHDHHVNERRLAFTGIQLLSPDIFSYMPDQERFSSIDLYRSMCRRGRLVKACRALGIYWQDMGTPQTYRDAGLRHLALEGIYEESDRWRFYPPKRSAAATGTDNIQNTRTPVRRKSLLPQPSLLPDDAEKTCFPVPGKKGWADEGLQGRCLADMRIQSLVGDGSPRQWVRVVSGDRSAVACDHGIQSGPPQKKNTTGTGMSSEYTAFIKIGRHLAGKGLPVPGILSRDDFSGQILLDDLGDTHLQEMIRKCNCEADMITWYKSVCDLLLTFSQEGIRGFDPAWTCQTPGYDRWIILEKECRYFVEACLQDLLEMRISFHDLAPVFEHIAGQCLDCSLTGLMHRDFQSRNLMVTPEGIRIIDFQSARKGPLQYDLASLLKDPYVNLPESVQGHLLAYATKNACDRTGFDPDRFTRGFRFCTLSRLMQALGAFSFLSRCMKKQWFVRYIPTAMTLLYRSLLEMEETEQRTLSPLTQIVQTALAHPKLNESTPADGL